MKKVLAIIASPREGNTYAACEALRAKLEKEEAQIGFEYLWLRDYALLPCKGCFNCLCKGEESCPNRDGAPLIEQKMREADLVIFATPVYVMNVTGLMKTFMDRFGYLGHRPRFFHTKAVILATTGGGGLSSVLKYLNKIIRVWGFEVIGQIGLVAPPDPHTGNPSLLRNTDERLSRAAAVIGKSFGRARRSPGLYETGLFHVWRGNPGMFEKYYPFDYQYWNERGWFAPGLKYFVDIPVNPLYVTIGKLLGSCVKFK